MTTVEVAGLNPASDTRNLMAPELVVWGCFVCKSRIPADCSAGIRRSSCGAHDTDVRQRVAGEKFFTIQHWDFVGRSF